LPRIDGEKAELDEEQENGEVGGDSREGEIGKRERRAAEARCRPPVPRLALRPAACSRDRRAYRPPLCLLP
jgi:hypothetical protein